MIIYLRNKVKMITVTVVNQQQAHLTVTVKKIKK